MLPPPQALSRILWEAFWGVWGGEASRAVLRPRSWAVLVLCGTVREAIWGPLGRWEQTGPKIRRGKI
eukprot:3758171-Pyramimonas_sp.AAC.1